MSPISKKEDFLIRDFSFCGLQEPFWEWLHWNTVFRRGETCNIFTREGKILLQTSSKAARRYATEHWVEVEKDFIAIRE